MNISAAQLYNSLPLLGDADEHFTDRSVLKDNDNGILPLVQLFAYHPAYSVCLVHRHCDLKEGERMVTRSSDNPDYDAVTCPSMDEDVYPHAWLADGTPFEYSKSPAPGLPRQLRERFLELVYPPEAVARGSNIWRGIRVLGICYIGTSAPPGDHTHRYGSKSAWVETTIRRNNYLKQMILTPEEALSKGYIRTSWSTRRADAEHLEDCAGWCYNPSGSHIQYQCIVQADGLALKQSGVNIAA
ncbi:hypothetical protein AX16_004538 [Volvariella volvacea WC 439]|nr:hypothetical protein AX16_004538 [Volvariella volvacea WC 439]